MAELTVVRSLAVADGTRSSPIPRGPANVSQRGPQLRAICHSIPPGARGRQAARVDMHRRRGPGDQRCEISVSLRPIVRPGNPAASM